MSWSEGDSRTCRHCHQPLRITGQQALWIHTDDQTGVHTSSHAACGPPWKEQTMSETTTTTETTVEPVPTEPEPAEPDTDTEDEPDNEDDEAEE